MLLCVFILALVRNLFCSGRAEQYVMCFEGEIYDKILCEAQEIDIRDVIECVWNRSSEPGCSVLMVEAL